MIDPEQVQNAHEAALKSICELVERNCHAPHRMGTRLYVVPHRYATLNPEFDDALFVANNSELVQQLSPLLILSAFEQPDSRLLTDNELRLLLSFLRMSHVPLDHLDTTNYTRHAERLNEFINQIPTYD